MEKTYLFYDIETTGLNKTFDQLVQFAAIRTDIHLQELERHEYYVKLNCDVIPSPQAFITHRIRPSQLQNGLDEFTAARKIHALFNTPGTISIGYNTLGFDDEFLRFTFYRNLLPPYTHQYANYCSRMDLYPITVMYFLFQNHLLKWPTDNLKLENISSTNNLSGGQAHNAMVDVIATLNLARYLQQEKETWDYVCGFFDKQTDMHRCQQVASDYPSFGIMVDGKFGYAQQYQSAVVPLGLHHHYKNQFLWLRVDTDTLLHATCEEFLQHTWVINKKIGETTWVLPMKERFLKSYLKEKYEAIRKNCSWYNQNNALAETLKKYYLNYTYPTIPNLDADATIYEKGFLSLADQEICRKIHAASPRNKLQYRSMLSQFHLQEILLRIMGRHFPDMLSELERQTFGQYLEIIRSDEGVNSVDYRGNRRMSLKQALNEIATLRKQSLDVQQLQILSELEALLNAPLNN